MAIYCKDTEMTIFKNRHFRNGGDMMSQAPEGF